jgi:hypothetical protein
MLRIIDQGILSRQTGHGAFFPVVTLLRDQSLVCTQFVADSLGADKTRMEMLHSDDGVSWTNAGLIEGGALTQEDGYAYRSSQLYEEDDGGWVLRYNRFHFRSEVIFDAEGCEQPSDMLIARSVDRGETWSEPEVVPVDLSPERYAWHGIGSMLRFPSGRWLYPFETGKPIGGIEDAPEIAGAVVSLDRGASWNQTVTVARDPSGRILYYDQAGCILPDGRTYVMMWTYDAEAKEHINNHITISEDEGLTWSQPQATNLRGQCCIPIALPDGRVAAIYNYRHEPQGVHVALSEDLVSFDTDNEAVVFDAGDDAMIREAHSDSVFDENLTIGFGRPFGMALPNGDLYTVFWCTREGVTHTRWVRLRDD